jgi:high-affinity nickel-transport protein
VCGRGIPHPARKIYHRITVHSLSVTVALAIGSVELLQVFATKFGLDTGVWAWLNALDFEKLGYLVVGLFVVTWAGSVVIWKTRRIDERWGHALRDS